MSLRYIISTLQRSMLLSCAVFLICVSAAGVTSLLQPVRYDAAATLFVSTPNADSVADLSLGDSYAQQIVKTLVQVATTPVVLGPAAKNVGGAINEEMLADQVSASVPDGTSIIQITASNHSSRTAAAVANAAALALADAATSLTSGGDGQRSVSARIIQRATVPLTPTQPRPLLNLAAGIFAGIFLAVAAAFVRASVDTRVRSKEDAAEASGANVLASIPVQRGSALTAETLLASSSSSPVAEAYRSLRAAMQFTTVDLEAKVIIVTSALAGEGKTTTASGLALTRARGGERALIVDADLRRPSVDRFFGLSGDVGLTDILAGRVSAKIAVQRWAEVLDVLPAGTLPPNPGDLMQTAALQHLLEVFRETYDVIIVDSPPLAVVADAASLSRLCDLSIVVTAPGSTSRMALGKVTQDLKASGSHFAGIVFNKERRSVGKAYSYHYGS